MLSTADRLRDERGRYKARPRLPVAEMPANWQEIHPNAAETIEETYRRIAHQALAHEERHFVELRKLILSQFGIAKDAQAAAGDAWLVGFEWGVAAGAAFVGMMVLGFQMMAHFP